jgi:hypothetical protein
LKGTTTLPSIGTTNIFRKLSKRLDEPSLLAYSVETEVIAHYKKTTLVAKQ